MAVEDRSLSKVLQDILRNLQDIVRSEVRLAKTELREEADKVKSSALLTGAGAVTALFALLFLLLTIVYALSLVLPIWAAALIVGSVLAVFAALLLMVGVRHFKQIHPVPERTVETLKEDVEWAKQQTK